jgi:hypothetical protein
LIGRMARSEGHGREQSADVEKNDSRVTCHE